MIPNLFYVVSLWERTLEGEEKIRDRLRIKQVDNEYIFAAKEYENQIPEGKLRLRTLNGISGIKVEAAGELTIAIDVLEGTDWVQKAAMKTLIVAPPKMH